MLSYAVKDIQTARHFYEEILRLKLTNGEAGEWYQYEAGETIFAICAADPETPMEDPEGLLAFEVPDLEAEVRRLRECGATVRRPITDAPECRFALVLDPDKHEIVIAARKQPS
jgi:predicted enzyme related to lactoylglutathione lyase